MKIPCGLAEDLLPLYLDQVCSPDSAALVQAHLHHCPACRQRLASLRQGGREEEEELQALQKARADWQRGRRRARWKGVLTALVVVFLGACALWYVWQGAPMKGEVPEGARYVEEVWA